MRIAFTSYRYNWGSYSIIRSLLERAREIWDVYWIDRVYRGRPEVDQAWILGHHSRSTAGEWTKVMFGLSDPAKFKEERLRQADIYFTNDLFLTQRQGGKVYYLPCFCDTRYHVPINVYKDIPVLFFGCKNHRHIPWRGRVVKELREAGVRVLTFGNGWKGHPDDNSFASGTQLVSLINRSQICLDLATPVSSLAHRIFEGSCCGTAVLTRKRADVCGLFREDEILLYEDEDQILDMIRYYLNRSEEISAVGARARDRCLKEHDVLHRLQTVREVLGI